MDGHWVIAAAVGLGLTVVGVLFVMWWSISRLAKSIGRLIRRQFPCRKKRHDASRFSKRPWNESPMKAHYSPASARRRGVTSEE
jgi:hypothetical protein